MAACDKKMVVTKSETETWYWDSGTWDSGTWDSGTWDSGTWDAGIGDVGSGDSGTHGCFKTPCVEIILYPEFSQSNKQAKMSGRTMDAENHRLLLTSSPA